MAEENNSIWKMSLQEAVQDPRVQNAASAVGNALISSPQELLAQMQTQPAVAPNSPMVNPPPNPAEMDKATQDVLLGAANPPKFQAPQNGMSNVPPQIPAEEQNIYPSDLEPAKPVSVVPAADPFAGLNMQMGAQKDLNAATQTLEKNRQSQLANTEQIQLKRVKQYEEMAAKYTAELNSRMKAVDDQLKQVDADVLNARKSTADLFHEKSTGQKVAAGIAMILGVAHAGLGGGTGGNMGVQLIEQSLQKDRELNLQKYAQSKEMLNLKRQNADDYAEMMSRQEAVLDKQQLLQLQAIETKLKQAESIYRGSASSANAKNALGILTSAKEQLKSQIAQQGALNQMLQNGDLSNLTPIQTLGLPENVRKAVEQTRELRVPGYGGVALSKEDRDQFQKYRQTAEPAINGLKRILELQKNTSRYSLQDRAKMASEVNAATGALREAIVGPGAMTEQEYDRLLATIGNPNKLFSLPSIEKAKVITALGKLKSDLNTIAGSRGLKPPAEFSINFKPADKAEADKILQKYVSPKK